MKKLLIVIDMQNDFINGSLGSPQAQNIVEAVKRKILQYRENDDEILFTRDTHHENYLETPEGSKLPVKHCIINTDGWNISNELDVESAVIWDKGSFGSHELAVYVKEESHKAALLTMKMCQLNIIND